MEELECDKDTAFESFIIKMNQTYNNEVEMYGDILRAGDSQLKVSIDWLERQAPNDASGQVETDDVWSCRC